MADVGDKAEQDAVQQQMQRVADKMAEILKARAKACEGKPSLPKRKLPSPWNFWADSLRLPVPVAYSGPAMSIRNPMPLPDTMAFRKKLAAVWEGVMALPRSPTWSTIIESLPAETWQALIYHAPILGNLATETAPNVLGQDFLVRPQDFTLQPPSHCTVASVYARILKPGKEDHREDE